MPPTRLKLHINSKLSKQNGLLSNVETGSQELLILSYVIVCLHPSVPSNNEKICHKLEKIKLHAVCEKTLGLRSGNFWDLNSAFYKVLALKNISAPRHVKSKSFSRHFSGSQQTAYFTWIYDLYRTCI